MSQESLGCAATLAVQVLIAGSALVLALVTAKGWWR